MTTHTLRLNPALNAAELAATYASDGLVQIPDIFEAETAQAISDMLRTSIPWRFVYQTPEQGTVQLSQEDIRSIGREGMIARMDEIMQLATNNYGFCYNSFQMVDALKNGEAPDHPIHELTRFLNSPEFLGFGSQVIGVTGITRADAHATLYSRGNFLTRHIDDGAKQERRAAYTLSFCKNWQTDWGGLLMFLDDNQDISRAYMPRFNTLTLFDGLRIHSVSPVSPFAGDGRFSIAGWLRDDPLQA